MSGVRHKVGTQARVIELYNAGWKPAELRRVLEREGHPVPSANTIWLWTHPGKADERRQRDLQKNRQWRTERASFAWPGVRGPEWKKARMLALRNQGVSYRDIARVMTMDFPKDPPVSEGQVRHLVRGSETTVLGCCARCNAEIKRYRDPGRPRKYCDDCRVSVTV